jgi:magnesium transporter
MGTRRVSIVRELDPDRIARLRGDGEFFWADLDLSGDLSLDDLCSAFKIDREDAEPLHDFSRGGSPARRIHVGDGMIVFPYWCASNPGASPLEGVEALGLFRVNVLLHGDFLLTVHEQVHDLPGDASIGAISAGRSERYVVYVALDGMTNTILEALATTEIEIGNLEQTLLERGLRSRSRDNEMVRALRSRLTGLRLRIGPQRALFERVGEEIGEIETLEGSRSDYFDRILAQLDRAVERIDAASQALSHALEIQLNETNYRLTIVATVFLPLGFIVGFFGMNFTWMVDHIDSQAAFLVFGIAIWLVPMIAIYAFLRVRDSLHRVRTTDHTY